MSTTSKARASAASKKAKALLPVKDRKWLRGRGPCKDGYKYALQFKSLWHLYEKCDRPCWLRWLYNYHGDSWFFNDDDAFVAFSWWSDICTHDHNVPNRPLADQVRERYPNPFPKPAPTKRKAGRKP